MGSLHNNLTNFCGKPKQTNLPKTHSLRIKRKQLNCYELLMQTMAFNSSEKGGHVYIICSLNHSTIYTGVTTNLPAWLTKHKEKANPNSFSTRYNCLKLVYNRWFETIIEVITE